MGGPRSRATRADGHLYAFVLTTWPRHADLPRDGRYARRVAGLTDDDPANGNVFELLLLYTSWRAS